MNMENTIRGTSEKSMITFAQHEQLGPTAKSLLAKFICSLCGFVFSKGKYLTNHYNFCKDVENPSDRLGVGTIAVNHEPSGEESQHTGLYDNHLTIEPKLDIKIELDSEFSETAISGQPIETLKTENPEELVKRSKCDYSDGQSTQLEEHVRSNVKSHKCHICDYSTTNRIYLIRHMTKYTRTNRLKYSSSDYASAQNDNLTVHVRTHRGDKPFKCRICKFATAYRTSLRVHMKRHTGDKPFKCTICDYASIDSQHLNRHLRKHTGERPFKCTICEFASAYRRSLRNHIRRHTGDKPFKCTICDYASVDSQSLNRHLRKHTGERPFKCTICEFACAHRTSLNNHMRRHTGDKPFK